LGTKLFLYRVTETPTSIRATQIPDFHTFGMDAGCAFIISLQNNKEVLQYSDSDQVSDILEFCSPIDRQGEELENFYINFLRLYTGFTEDQLSTILKDYKNDGDLLRYINALILLEKKNQNVEGVSFD
jgi:hypothetical protein